MRILITGANGHIGANTVRHLLQDGHEVVAFVRQEANLLGLDGLDIEICTGDIRDAASLVEASKDCEVIVHCAAVYNMVSNSHEEIVAPVMSGIDNVFQAIETNNIRRLVYTSSIAAVGFSDNPNQLRTPADWHEDPQNPYVVAKAESEKRALQLAEASGIEMISLCPSVVLGTLDYRVTPSTGMILGLATGLATTWEGGTNLVDVQDVAAVHAAAVTKGEPGQRYIIGGQNIHSLDIGSLLEELIGVKPDHFGADRATAKAMAKQMETEAQSNGTQPAITTSIVHEMTQRYAYFDTTLTNETFNLEPKQAREVLVNCLNWLNTMGLLETAVSVESTTPVMQSA